MKGKGENQEPWLLIKEKDEHVKAAAEFSVVDAFPHSVKELRLPGSKPPARKAAPSSAAPAKKAAKARFPAAAPAANAPKAALPEKFAPQLATLVDKPPADPENWVYEIKFDGYRLLARVDGADVKLFTRNGNAGRRSLRRCTRPSRR
jgi:bifunctional non-homologous end joining protein LigD